VTPETLQRKRRKAAIKKARYEKSKAEAAEYHKLLMQVGVLAGAPVSAPWSPLMETLTQNSAGLAGDVALQCKADAGM
jgi:hypothetical protein